MTDHFARIAARGVAPAPAEPAMAGPPLATAGPEDEASVTFDDVGGGPVAGRAEPGTREPGDLERPRRRESAQPPPSRSGPPTTPDEGEPSSTSEVVPPPRWRPAADEQRRAVEPPGPAPVAGEPFVTPTVRGREPAAVAAEPDAADRRPPTPPAQRDVAEADDVLFAAAGLGRDEDFGRRDDRADQRPSGTDIGPRQEGPPERVDERDVAVPVADTPTPPPVPWPSDRGEDRTLEPIPAPPGEVVIGTVTIEIVDPAPAADAPSPDPPVRRAAARLGSGHHTTSMWGW